VRIRPVAPAPILVASLLLAACAAPDADGGGTADEQAATASDAGAAPADSAQLLHERLVRWQGGREAWERTRYLAFRWIVERDGEVVAERSHAWDRWEGRNRVSFERDDGSRFVAVFDLASLRDDSLPPEGEVRVGGERLEGAARDSALRQAYGAFINDSYWLVMPLKWGDPGVHLSYEGWTELPDGERSATVHLGFDEGLGVTNDEYWGYVEPETGRMVAWRYHLQGREQKGPVIWWRDWRSFGPQELKLSLDRRWSDGSETRIHFEDVVADTALPAGTFELGSE